MVNLLISAEPALVLAPMDGITDAPMRAFQGASGAFSYAVSEFIRVSIQALPTKVFLRAVPELANGGRTPTGLPVQVQILGGDPGRMAQSAANACRAGATAIDINFGCPAPTVNRNDGGASLLRCPARIREVVAAVREAVPDEFPVSAKLRLGWDDINAIDENAEMAVAGGAAWLTIHARTRVQGYQPPVYWEPVRRVREALGVPVIANGDLWNFSDFERCRDETGCIHFMVGRGALANPALPGQIARALGIGSPTETAVDWTAQMKALIDFIDLYGDSVPKRTVHRLKQWLKLAHSYGDFAHFDRAKHAQTVEELFECLAVAA